MHAEINRQNQRLQDQDQDSEVPDCDQDFENSISRPRVESRDLDTWLVPTVSTTENHFSVR